MMGVTEAAKILGVSTVTVQRRLRSGELQGEKLGRAWVITDPVVTEALRRKRDFFATPPDVSPRVRDKGMSLFDHDMVKLLSTMDSMSWTFIVYGPKPHLVAITFTEEKPLRWCDCEWMRANPDVPCSHLYAACLWIINEAGELPNAA